MDDFAKEFRAAAVDKKASDLTSLFVVNGQPDLESTKTSSQGREVILQEGLRDEDHQLARRGVRSFDEFPRDSRASTSAFTYAFKKILQRIGAKEPGFSLELGTGEQDSRAEQQCYALQRCFREASR